MQAVVDTQIDVIAHAFSEVLNLNTSLAEQRDPWLHRLLRETVPLAHEVEKLVALLVACAQNAGWSERQVARSMGRATDDVARWRTQDADAVVAAATEQELGDDWNMASAEAYLSAQCSVEDKEEARSRAYRLMCLLLLHDTPSYEADSLTWVDDKTRRCVKNGWFLQARRATSSANAMPAPEPTVQSKVPPQGCEASTPQTKSA